MKLLEKLTIVIAFIFMIAVFFMLTSRSFAYTVCFTGDPDSCATEAEYMADGHTGSLTGNTINTLIDHLWSDGNYPLGQYPAYNTEIQQ